MELMSSVAVKPTKYGGRDSCQWRLFSRLY